ncbi:hypothetical protein H4R34_003533 [Dimargaris verticillata]|uniref:PH domain-containing protein n=1 Tax=Dimargaris verticillata TaxID=2761393 RepID=A0A9W8B4D1_9FUNG|nr:hypothetical protein H4R34_003533 [Dimargaris verticillata]
MFDFIKDAFWMGYPKKSVPPTALVDPKPAEPKPKGNLGGGTKPFRVSLKPLFRNVTLGTGLFAQKKILDTPPAFDPTNHDRPTSPFAKPSPLPLLVAPCPTTPPRPPSPGLSLSPKPPACLDVEQRPTDNHGRLGLSPDTLTSRSPPRPAGTGARVHPVALPLPSSPPRSPSPHTNDSVPAPINKRSRRSSIHGLNTVSAPLLKRETEIQPATNVPVKDRKPPSGIFYVRVLQLEYFGVTKPTAFQCCMEVGNQTCLTDAANTTKLDKTTQVARFGDVFVFDILHPFTFKLTVLPKPLNRSKSTHIFPRNAPQSTPRSNASPAEAKRSSYIGQRLNTPSKWFHSLANRRSRMEGQVLSELYLDFGFRRLTKETRTYNMPLLYLSSSEVRKRSLEVTLEVGIVIEHDPFSEDGKYMFPAKPWLVANGYTDSVRSTIHKSRLSYNNPATPSCRRPSRVAGTRASLDASSAVSERLHRSLPRPTYHTGYLSIFIRSRQEATWKRFWVVLNNHSLYLFHPTHKDSRPKCGRIPLVHLSQVLNPSSKVITVGPNGLELSFTPMAMTNKQRRQSAFPHPLEIRAAKEVLERQNSTRATNPATPPRLSMSTSLIDTQLTPTPPAPGTGGPRTGDSADTLNQQPDLDQWLDRLNIPEEETESFYNAWFMRVYIMAEDTDALGQWKAKFQRELHVLRKFRDHPALGIKVLQERLALTSHECTDHRHLLAKPTTDSLKAEYFGEETPANAPPYRRESRSLDLDAPPLDIDSPRRLFLRPKPLSVVPLQNRFRNLTQPVRLPMILARQMGTDMPVHPKAARPTLRQGRHRSTMHIDTSLCPEDMAVQSYVDSELDTVVIVDKNRQSTTIFESNPSSQYKQEIVKVLDQMDTIRDERRQRKYSRLLPRTSQSSVRPLRLLPSQSKSSLRHMVLPSPSALTRNDATPEHRCTTRARTDSAFSMGSGYSYATSIQTSGMDPTTPSPTSPTFRDALNTKPSCSPLPTTLAAGANASALSLVSTHPVPVPHHTEGSLAELGKVSRRYLFVWNSQSHN